MKKSILLLCWMFFCCAVAFAQTTVRGKVTDANKEAIPGVSIMVKGSTVGASTDANGAFSISAPANGTLVFKSIGFQTMEVPVRNRTEINVSLSSVDQQLDEVMVVAYGTAKRSTFTGSATNISADKIKDAPSTSFENALNGKVPGLQLTSASGQAGAVSSVRIRGIGSMNASNEPLYVVDGVPVVSGDAGQLSDYTRASNNVMSSINPADIESITVLKDAAASALYGSRAANGVIIINTKRGRTGKPEFSFKTSVGLTPSWATDNYETAGIQEQTNMLYRIFYDAELSSSTAAKPKTPTDANAYAVKQLNTKFNKHGYKFSTNGISLSENVNISGMADGIENREGQYFDWEEALFRTGVYQTNDLSVSGGNEGTTYFSSFSYTKDKSRVRLNEFDRFSGRVNVSQKVGKFLDFTTNVSAARSSQIGFNDTRNTSTNYFMQQRNMLWTFYWPTNYKTGQPWTDRYGSLGQNNVFYDQEWENSSITRRITANETVTLTLLPELNIKTILSYDNSQVKDHLYYSALHFNGSTDNGVVHEMTTNINKLVSSSTINYNKSFNLHNFGFLAGFEVEKNETDFMRASGKDMPSKLLPTVSTAGSLTSSGYAWGNSMVSALSRLEYNFDEKYFASASFRRDGSSRLGPETRWGNFWSVAGAWKISGEDFMKDNTVINNLRLRASYGVNGTLPSSNYGWRTLTGYGAKYTEKPGGGIISIPDPNLTWETSYTTNLGLEFGLFNNRLFGTLEYFNRDSKNLLQDVPISMVTGFSSTLRNIGEINNKGIELELGGVLISNDEFKWTASVNAAFIKSKVTKLYKGENESTGRDIIWVDPTGTDARAQYVYREGESTLSFYGYEWAGVDPANGKNMYYVNKEGDPTAGDFLLNGRGATHKYTNSNYVIIGAANPKVYGGLSTNFEYKGFNLGLNFNYKIGGKIYDGAYRDMADDGYYWERIRGKDVYTNMWTPENTSGTLPKLDGNDLVDPMQYSSRQLHDGTFLRLKTVSLAYNLPNTWVNKIGLSSTRLYFNGTNLLTFSKYKIADPEVNQYGTRGWELPYGKIYTFGLEVKF